MNLLIRTQMKMITVCMNKNRVVLMSHSVTNLLWLIILMSKTQITTSSMNHKLLNLCETTHKRRKRMSMIKSMETVVAKKTRSHKSYHSSHLAVEGSMIQRVKIIVMKTLRSLKVKMKECLWKNLGIKWKKGICSKLYCIKSDL